MAFRPQRDLRPDLNDETIVILETGPAAQVWEMMDERVGESGGTESALGEFLTGALGTTKLHALAVRPDQQGRGHGSRLMRYIIDLANRDGMLMMFGQYGSDRPHLLAFYSSLGFRVLEPGQPLQIYAVTGRDEYLHALPHDTFIVWQRRAALSPDP